MAQNVFRNINILSKFDSSNTSQTLAIYTPGTSNPSSIVSGVKYSGFITALRLIVNIKSIDEFQIPNVLSDDSEEIARLKEKEAVLASPRIGMQLFLKNTGTVNPILVSEILLFNRYPYYFIPLIPYFSDSNTFDVAPDTIITLKVKDVGYGLLKAGDELTIVGSAIEEGIDFSAVASTETTQSTGTGNSDTLGN